MPFAHNGEFATWYETVGSGPPLVMYHGLTGTGGRWRDTGYVDGLQERFRFLRDARGVRGSMRLRLGCGCHGGGELIPEHGCLPIQLIELRLQLA